MQCSGIPQECDHRTGEGCGKGLPEWGQQWLRSETLCNTVDLSGGSSQRIKSNSHREIEMRVCY